MKLIIGKLNEDNNIRYWNASGFTPDVAVGDYAIVENINDYDLVKIIGIVETEEKYTKFLVPRGVSKNVVKYLERSQVRKD